MAARRARGILPLKETVGTPRNDAEGAPTGAAVRYHRRQAAKAASTITQDHSSLASRLPCRETQIAREFIARRDMHDGAIRWDARLVGNMAATTSRTGEFETHAPDACVRCIVGVAP